MSTVRAARILFAHARQEEADAIEEGIVTINTFFPDAEVVAARDDWKKNQSSMESQAIRRKLDGAHRERRPGIPQAGCLLGPGGQLGKGKPHPSC